MGSMSLCPKKPQKAEKLRPRSFWPKGSPLYVGVIKLALTPIPISTMNIPPVPTRHKIQTRAFQTSMTEEALYNLISRIVESDPSFNHSFVVPGKDFEKFTLCGLEQYGDISFMQGNVSLDQRNELSEHVVSLNSLIVEYRQGDSLLLNRLIRKMGKKLNEYPQAKKEEEMEMLSSLPMFFLSIRGSILNEFLIPESVVESARRCFLFDDIPTLFSELQVLSRIPHIIEGSSVPDDLDMHIPRSRINFYRNQKFAKVRVLYKGKKYQMDNRFVVKSEKTGHELMLYVKWVPRLRKLMIGYVVESDNDC